MHVADRLVNLLSPLSLLTHALTKVAHVSNDIIIEGLGTATCNLIFFFGSLQNSHVPIRLQLPPARVRHRASRA